MFPLSMPFKHRLVWEFDKDGVVTKTAQICAQKHIPKDKRPERTGKAEEDD
jgi:hypothetical protein